MPIRAQSQFAAPLLKPMIEHNNTIVIVTARMSAHGLPGLPMADVAGQPLLIRACRAAASANLGQVLVATPDMPIAEAMRAVGLDAMMSRPRHQGPVILAAEALSLRDPDNRFTHVLLLDVASATGFDHLTLRRSLAGLTNDTVDMVATANLQANASDIALSALGADREVALLRGVETAESPRDGWQLQPLLSFRRSALDRLAAALAVASNPRPHDLAVARDAGLRVAVVQSDRPAKVIDSMPALEALRMEMKDKA